MKVGGAIISQCVAGFPPPVVLSVIISGIWQSQGAKPLLLHLPISLSLSSTIRASFLARGSIEASSTMIAAATTHLHQPSFDCTTVFSLKRPLSPSALPHSSHLSLFRVGTPGEKWGRNESSCSKTWFYHQVSRQNVIVPRSSGSSDSNGAVNESSTQDKTPFGYTRKDVLLIGLGVTVFGYGLKTGLEFVGVDPLQAGNVVQLVVVLGMTVAWISTYMFRVASKDMTYAQQLRDYEKKVMEKRLEGLTEAELQVLLEQVEEEKRRLANGEQVN